MSMSDQTAYWFADATGLSLNVLKTKVTGQGIVRIPLSDKTRLSCKLKIVASRFYPKASEYALMMHVRGDLYLFFALFENGKGSDEGGVCLLVDGAKLPVKPEKVFNSHNRAYKAMSALQDSVVARYKNNGMNSPWKKLSANRLDKSGNKAVS